MAVSVRASLVWLVVLGAAVYVYKNRERIFS